jgi:hypothetical protein
MEWRPGTLFVCRRVRAITSILKKWQGSRTKPAAAGIIFDSCNCRLTWRCSQLGIAAIGSATLYQGRLTHGLPAYVKDQLGFKTDGENAIQFARSAPGLLTALVGMGQREHVAQNIKPALVPPSRADLWEKLFQRNA